MTPPLANLHEYDLSALRTRVDGDRRYAALVKAIRIGEAHRAVELDLRMSWDALEVLSRTMASPGADGVDQEHDNAVVSRALMSNAVMLYCRALVSKSADGRFTVGVPSTYNAEQRSWHKHMADLRNKVLAHHGEGDALELGPWMRARLLATPTGPDFQFEITNAQEETANALSGLIVSALEWLDGERPAWVRRLGDELERLLSVDSRLPELLDQCIFTHENAFVGPRTGPNEVRNRVVAARDGHLRRLNGRESAEAD